MRCLEGCKGCIGVLGAVLAGLLLYRGVPAQAGSGSVSLSWSPVTTRVDGEPLPGPVHYAIYYGLVDGSLVRTIGLAPGITQHVIDELSAGRYFFSVTAIDEQGLESAPSSLAYKDIQAPAAGEPAGSPEPGGEIGQAHFAALLALLHAARAQADDPTPSNPDPTPSNPDPSASGIDPATSGTSPATSVTGASAPSGNPVSSGADSVSSGSDPAIAGAALSSTDPGEVGAPASDSAVSGSEAGAAGFDPATQNPDPAASTTDLATPNADAQGPAPQLAATDAGPEAAAFDSALPAEEGTTTALPDVSTHAATLSWSPVTTRVDGSVLPGLEGYRIYHLYRAASEEYRSGMTQVVAGITETVLENLPLGRVFFTVTAVDTQGLESAPSNVASKDIR